MLRNILYIYTRTPLHVGAGSSVGAIDHPVSRERATGTPNIPGSAIKGVIADGYLEKDRKSRTEAGRALLGHEKPEADDAKSGSVSFGEARLLAFPVRSAKGCFAWVTSPLLLQRWSRETGVNLGQIPTPVDLQLYGDRTLLAHDGKVVLEDYAFIHTGAFAAAGTLAALMNGSDSDTVKTVETVWTTLAAGRLCLISDDLLAHFAMHACEIAYHNCIDDETGVVKDGLLFNQENVPAETLFYSVLRELRPGALNNLAVPSTIQIGADATTGLGFCSTKLATN
jgi:CRISPR-associated protein Cmr4